MAKLVKKVGSKTFYEINSFRAGGLLVFYVDNDKIKILINQEIRNNNIVYNLIGGKVDRLDNNIEDTMLREFNEETGYLASSLIKDKINSNNLTIKLEKSKYISQIIEIKPNNRWLNLPKTFSDIFDDVEDFGDRDSLKLFWMDLYFDFNNNNSSYLLIIILSKLKNFSFFKKFDPDNEPLFVD